MSVTSATHVSGGLPTSFDGEALAVAEAAFSVNSFGVKQDKQSVCANQKELRFT